jgi:hypothetical protein
MNKYSQLLLLALKIFVNSGEQVFAKVLSDRVKLGGLTI